MASETCPWLIVVGYEDDGWGIITGECGNIVPEDNYDGLCDRHTRGESLEDYYAPGGTAWMEEMHDARY